MENWTPVDSRLTRLFIHFPVFFACLIFVIFSFFSFRFRKISFSLCLRYACRTFIDKRRKNIRNKYGLWKPHIFWTNNEWKLSPSHSIEVSFGEVFIDENVRSKWETHAAERKSHNKYAVWYEFIAAQRKKFQTSKLCSTMRPCYDSNVLKQ